MDAPGIFEDGPETLLFSSVPKAHMKPEIVYQIAALQAEIETQFPTLCSERRKTIT